MIRNNQNRRRRGGNNNNGPRPQQMNGGNNYGARLDNRQRGNASQLLEKYRALARDAQQAGDRVTAEYYLQYADHYYRVLGDYREKTPADGRQRGQNTYDDDSAGYSANGDDGDDGDDDQDGDRGETRGQDDRGENRSEGRGDENRSQWRDDRGGQNGGQSGNQNGGQTGNRNRDGQREPRSEPRADGNRNENRDRQSWNGNSAPRSRDDNRPERVRDENRAERPRDDNRSERVRDDNRAERPRDDSRPERPRDENRSDRPRDENRGDRNINRDRRPDGQRQPQVEATAEVRQTESRIADEGPIPGLPGPATLRIKRPVEDEVAPRPERAARAPRRVVTAVEPAVLPFAEPMAAESPDVDGEPAAPRRRGRPRKIVDAIPVEG